MMAPIGILVVAAAIVIGLLTLMVYAFGGIATMAICFTLVSLLMMMVILIQKPKGGGLSGAFGGGGGGAEAAFGAKTGDVLTWVTIVCFVAFLGLAMGLTWQIGPVDPDASAEVDVMPPSAMPTQEAEELEDFELQSTPPPANGSAPDGAPAAE